jgi:hypothetical protein
MRFAISMLLLIRVSNQQDSESCTEIAEEPRSGLFRSCIRMSVSIDTPHAFSTRGWSLEPVNRFAGTREAHAPHQAGGSE